MKGYWNAHKFSEHGLSKQNLIINLFE